MRKRGNIKIICDNCGETIMRWSSDIKNNKRSFCSKKCEVEARTGVPNPWLRKSKEALCDWCGEIIYIGSFQERNFEKHFCDKDCHAQWKRVYQCGTNNPSYKDNEIDVICNQCGISFKRKPHLITEGKDIFCSRQCWGKFNSGANNVKYIDNLMEISCEFCGKIVNRKASQLKYHKQSFCSKECYALAITGEGSSQWKGGTSRHPYGKEWVRRLKEYIRDRDNRQCQICYTNESELRTKLCVHHLDGDKKNCAEDNLLSLCRSCHGRVEHSQYKLELLRDDPDYRYIVAMG